MVCSLRFSIASHRFGWARTGLFPPLPEVEDRWDEGFVLGTEASGSPTRRVGRLRAHSEVLPGWLDPLPRRFPSCDGSGSGVAQAYPNQGTLRSIPGLPYLFPGIVSSAVDYSQRQGTIDLRKVSAEDRLVSDPQGGSGSRRWSDLLEGDDRGGSDDRKHRTGEVGDDLGVGSGLDQGAVGVHGPRLPSGDWAVAGDPEGFP